ncbi:hypothetical protein HCG51_14775 [Tolypothrix sp. PCC 7910]|nr:hypothetical protein HCG51_14775 [Tolypothrix sp. PCC 7910]
MNWEFVMQISFGLNIASLLGYIYIIFGISYMAFMVFLLFKRASRLGSIAFVIYLLQALLIPSIMLLCGFIFVFQGWRLDPILQFAQFLLTSLVIYFSVKDIVINEVYKNR